MISSLLTLSLLTNPGQAAWNLDSTYAISPGMNQAGFSVELNLNTALSPFQKGPQLETSLNSTLGSGIDGSRFGLGLRQELSPTVAVSAHALNVNHDGSSRSGLEGTLSWKIWRSQAPDNTMGLGLYVYGGTTLNDDDAWWWSGAGLQMSLGT